MLRQLLELSTLSLRSPLAYVNQQHSLKSEIALSICIPDPILKWHKLVGIKDNGGNELHYIDFLISFGFSINGSN